MKAIPHWITNVTRVGLIFSVLTGHLLATKDHKKLIEDLFNNYTKLARPVRNAKTPTNVEMILFLSQVIHMDERMQTLKVNAWITMIWTDEYLMWDPKEYGGIDVFTLPSGNVWMPDITLYNNADKYKNWLLEHIVKIDYNGTVMWAAPEIFTSYCKINVMTFPFDEQMCKMKFGPWQHDGSQVKLMGLDDGPGDDEVFNSDGQWDMVSMSVNTSYQEYPDDPGKQYWDVEYTFKFKRRPLYYLFNLVIPTMFLSLVAMLTFFLPPESGEKISLGITVLLSLTVFLLLVAETMPPTSTVPVIGQYFASTMVLISISLAMSVGVLNMHHIGPDFAPVPPWMKKHILGTLARFLGMTNKPPPGSQKNNVIGEKLAQDFRTWEQQELLSIVHNQVNSSPRIRHTRSYIPCNGVTLGSDLSDDLRQSPCPPDHGSTSSISTPINKQCDVLKELLREVRKLTNHIEEDSTDKKIKDEWKRVALVLDRFFFIFFVIGTCGTYMIMFAQM
ncbi:neuronal acetylcholine receptor subunit alpha-10-like isoform X2 [Amphiura filiformis]|uniref:neuronal acetylcholine receptor subunit alpha-10-like isoform X2 n=1 Tax=Amphiura filiformis TaxID=82378 RepID=UPI003B21100C